MSDPLDMAALEDVRALLNLNIKPVIVTETQILKNQKTYYEIEDKLMDMLTEHNMANEQDLELQTLEDDSILDDDSDLNEAEGAPVVMLLNSILSRAIESKASDIHIEPGESKVKIRFRIDGLLSEILAVPRNFHGALVSRIKIISKLDIAERRKPQDGRSKIQVGNTTVDLRISTLPTFHGEKVVFRVLDSSRAVLSLEETGMFPKDVETLESILRFSRGIILVTGPTGSGKTSTLYACLHKVKDITKNIVTVEDPIEYQVEGINQMQVNPKIKLTFAAGLRSILRQDPDVIMVGEIRDSETVLIAIQAALTGHLVLSTLHTNDAVSAITRLINMGVEPFLLSATLMEFRHKDWPEKSAPDVKNLILLNLKFLNP